MKDVHDFRARARTFCLALALDPEDEDPIVELMCEVAEACAKVCDANVARLEAKGFEFSSVQSARDDARNIRAMVNEGGDT